MCEIVRDVGGVIVTIWRAFCLTVLRLMGNNWTSSIFVVAIWYLIFAVGLRITVWIILLLWVMLRHGDLGCELG